MTIVSEGFNFGECIHLEQRGALYFWLYSTGIFLHLFYFLSSNHFIDSEILCSVQLGNTAETIHLMKSPCPTHGVKQA